MTKLMKNFLVVFFFMICSIFAEVKIPHEIITENPSREVKIVESKKLKEKAEMNITVKKLTPLEIDGGITSSNGKYVIDTGKYDVKELNKDNFLVVKDLNELKKGIDINGNFLRENIQSQINFEVEIMENKIFLNIENIEDVYVTVIYQSKIVKIFHCNPVTLINTIDAKINITQAKVENKNNFIISKNILELDKNMEGVNVENKITSTNSLRSRRSIEPEKLVDSMKIITGEKSIFVKGLEYTENPNYNIQLKDNGKDFVLTKKNNNKLNENIVIEYYSDNVQIGELKLAILNGNVTTDLGNIVYRVDGRLRGVTGKGLGYTITSPNVLNDFSWISKKDTNTSVDGIKEAVLQKTVDGSTYEFPGMIEYDMRNYDNSYNDEVITSIEAIGLVGENLQGKLTDYVTNTGNVALNKSANTIGELIESMKMGVNRHSSGNTQNVNLVINNTYTLNIIREEVGQPQTIYDITASKIVNMYTYNGDGMARLIEKSKANAILPDGSQLYSEGEGYAWPKVTGNTESYKGKLVATKFQIKVWNSTNIKEESVDLSLGSGGRIVSTVKGHIYTLESNGTLCIENKDLLGGGITQSLNLMYVKNGYNIILARLGSAFLSSEGSINNDGLIISSYAQYPQLPIANEPVILEIDPRLKKILKAGQVIVSNGQVLDLATLTTVSKDNYKNLLTLSGNIAPFDGYPGRIDYAKRIAKISENLNAPIEEMEKGEIIKEKSVYEFDSGKDRIFMNISNYVITTSSKNSLLMKVGDMLKDIAVDIYNNAKNIKIYIGATEGFAVVKYGWKDFNENREHHATGTFDLSTLKKEESVQFGKDNVNIPGLVLNGELYDLRSIDNSVTNITTKLKIEKLSSDGSVLETKFSYNPTANVYFEYNTFSLDSNGNLTITKREFNEEAIKYRIIPCYNDVELGSITLDITNGKESTFGIYGDNTFDFGKLVPGRDSILSGVMHITNSGDERIIKVEVDKTSEMIKTGGSTPVPLEIAAANEVLPEKDKNNVVIKSHMVVKAKPPKEAEAGEYKGQFQVIITVDR